LQCCHQLCTHAAGARHTDPLHRLSGKAPPLLAPVGLLQAFLQGMKQVQAFTADCTESGQREGAELPPSASAQPVVLGVLLALGLRERACYRSGVLKRHQRVPHRDVNRQGPRIHKSAQL
jgi:hypothetical protein